MHDASDADFRSRLHEELERLERVRPGGDVPPAPFTGYVTRRWLDLLNDSPIWQEVAMHPCIVGVMPGALGDDFLLSTMATALIGPGEAAQPLHVDDVVYEFPRPHPELMCNTLWAVEDFTAENGATLFVRGSNRFDHEPEPRADYPVEALEMPAGSLAFVSGTTYHAGGHNRTDCDRVGLTINYCRGAMRQQENLMLAVRPERMMTFAPALQDMLGFRMRKGAGHLFGSDPRAELERRFGAGAAYDVWFERRDALHAERTRKRREAPPRLLDPLRAATDAVVVEEQGDRIR